MEEKRTPKRQIIDNVSPCIFHPVIHLQELARMSEKQVERIHHNYYLSQGYRIEEIPNNPYNIFVAQQERARYQEEQEREWQHRQDEKELHERE